MYVLTCKIVAGGRKTEFLYILTLFRFFFTLFQQSWWILSKKLIYRPKISLRYSSAMLHSKYSVHAMVLLWAEMFYLRPWFIGSQSKKGGRDLVVFIWCHILRNFHEVLLQIVGSYFLATSWNVSNLNQCWFELACKRKIHLGSLIGVFLCIIHI